MKIRHLLLLFLGATLVLPVRAESRIDTPSAPPPLLLGAAWYPEQWPESRWNADLGLMQQAHLHLARVGEFAWSSLEPEEGHYTLDWLERAIDAAGKHGIYVVLGTPSAAPPAWLTEKYPETLRTLPDGERDTHGSRQQFNWSDAKYREFVRTIDEQLAKRFGHNPYVIAWQIGNEYAYPSYDAGTRSQFQSWLHAKYGTLANLNRRWATAYWSQTYFEWNQIPLDVEHGNPGLQLAWKQFVSDTWRSYQRNQIDVIRRYADPRQRITTNMMGWFEGYDHTIVAKDLDFIAWDDPLGSGHLDPIRNGAAHDLMRGLKGRDFWVMETTAGPTGWGNPSTMLDKGEMRAALWHDIGHGADGISYWQWRDALNGQEQNHGAIVSVDGRPDPIYAEIAQVGREFEKVGPAIQGTSVHARVAILHSYNSRWVLNWQRLSGKYDSIDELLSYYKPLHEAGYSIDIVSPDQDLSQYKLLIAPGLNVITQNEADNLIRYVRAGGHLVLGQRSGMKDGDNARWPQRQPGPLEQLLGARVEQYFALAQPVPTSGAWGTCPAQLYAEQLSVQAPDVQVLQRYGVSDGWLDGQPAAVTRQVGHGSISYIGIWLDIPGMSRAVKWMLAMSSAHPDLPPVPMGVEVYRRSGAGHSVYIFENFSSHRLAFPLSGKMTNLLAGGTVNTLSLGRYGVAVVAANTSAAPRE